MDQKEDVSMVMSSKPEFVVVANVEEKYQEKTAVKYLRGTETNRTDTIVPVVEMLNLHDDDDNEETRIFAEKTDHDNLVSDDDVQSKCRCDCWRESQCLAADFGRTLILKSVAFIVDIILMSFALIYKCDHNSENGGLSDSIGTTRWLFVAAITDIVLFCMMAPAATRPLPFVFALVIFSFYVLWVTFGFILWAQSEHSDPCTVMVLIWSITQFVYPCGGFYFCWYWFV